MCTVCVKNHIFFPRTYLSQKQFLQGGVTRRRHIAVCARCATHTASASIHRRAGDRRRAWARPCSIRAARTRPAVGDYHQHQHQHQHGLRSGGPLRIPASEGRRRRRHQRDHPPTSASRIPVRARRCVRATSPPLPSRPAARSRPPPPSPCGVAAASPSRSAPLRRGRTPAVRDLSLARCAADPTEAEARTRDRAARPMLRVAAPALVARPPEGRPACSTPRAAVALARQWSLAASVAEGLSEVVEAAAGCAHALAVEAAAVRSIAVEAAAELLVRWWARCALDLMTP